MTQLTDEAMLDRRDRREQASLWTATSDHGVVSSAHFRATAVGARMLAAGGNAVDAALATSFALSVTESAGSGLGGMAMMLLRGAASGQTHVLAGPCRAPRHATPEAVQASRRYSGYKAIAVPAYVSVMEAAHEEFGTLPLGQLLEGAIDLAENGFSLTPHQVEVIAQHRRALARSNARGLFLGEDGQAPAPKTSFRQPMLAKTLRRLAHEGLRDFYEGAIASEIAADMTAHGGFIDLQDLASVPRPSPTAPVSAPFFDGTVATVGFPAGGETLLEMLNLYAELEPRGLDPDRPDGAVLLAAIIRRAREDRRRYRLRKASAPDYASVAYARAIAPGLNVDVRSGSGETSHISIIDGAGNAVSLTQSIERSFGAKCATPSLGFLHNGYMKGFKLEARKHPHFLKPGAVARSNAAPTIVSDARGARICIGSTGSERMLSSIFLVLARLRQGALPFDAVVSPRFHATPDGALLLEQERVQADVVDAFARAGYAFEDMGRFAFRAGGLHMVVAGEQTWTGVAEPRRDGAASGPDGPPPEGLPKAF